jgi:polysaccharide biosynthesis/export protein
MMSADSSGISMLLRPSIARVLGVVLVTMAVVDVLVAQSTSQPRSPATPAQTPKAPPPKPSPQAPAAKPPTAKPPASKPPAATPQGPDALKVPVDYIIGPDDVLGIMFWRDKDMSVEQVVVRPDGMVTLPLLNDVKAAGLTPDEFREQVMKAATQYVEDPNVTIVIRQINSRKVYVTGNVSKPGSFPLTGPTTVMQALAMAGGLTEYAEESDIVIMRTVNAKTQTFKFNYKDVIKGKKLEQNIELRPGDTIIVP